jgi:hypothetical protein
MSYKFVAVHVQSPILTLINELAVREEHSRNIYVPELGIRWLQGQEYIKVEEEINEFFRLQGNNIASKIILIVEDEKKWLVAKLRYNI